MEQQIQYVEKTYGIDASGMIFDEEKVDRRWEDKYGITSKNLLVRAKNGELYDDRRLKGIFIDGLYRYIVGRGYVIFPNEEADILVRNTAQELNLTVEKVYTSHHDDAWYWQLISEKLDQNIFYKNKNDVVRIGVVAKNGLGVNVGLGIDLFTWRVFCENGAVAKGHDAGMTLHHVGKYEKLVSSFLNNMDTVLRESKDLLKYYQKMTELRINRKIAEALAKRLPQKVLPPAITLDEKTNKILGVREDNLWESFNDVTKAIWHDKSMQFAHKANLERSLHKAIQIELAPLIARR